MSLEKNKILDIVLPYSISKNEKLTEDIIKFINLDNNEDMISYYEQKILHQLTDNEILAIHVLNDYLECNNKLYKYISVTNNRLKRLINNNIENEIGTKDHKELFVTGFDIDKYVEDFRYKFKYEIFVKDTKHNILILDDEYIKYLCYVKYNLDNIGLFNNLNETINKKIYDVLILDLLYSEFKNSDVPAVGKDRFHILNKYMKDILS